MLSLFAIYGLRSNYTTGMSDLSTNLFATVCTVPINMDARLIALAVNMKPIMSYFG